MNRLIRLEEEENPELATQDSPTRRIGGEPLPAICEVVHQVPMESLSDVFSEEEWRTLSGE
jgi:DNA ligase (NAD+)